MRGQLTPQSSIHIGEIVIHQSENGLYSLNDLHIASGGESTDRPGNWLKTRQARDYASFLQRQNCSSEKSVLEVTNGGKHRGTYAVKELAYTYAMWISVEFHHFVVTAFDAFMMEAHNAWSQGQLSTRHAHDEQTLGVILGVTARDLRPYFQHLEFIKEVRAEAVPQQISWVGA